MAMAPVDAARPGSDARWLARRPAPSMSDESAAAGAAAEGAASAPASTPATVSGGSFDVS
jgi:hypothetical protein